MKTDILGTKVDFVTTAEAAGIVEDWLSKKGKHYIVTPNPEMIVDSRHDLAFRSALNEADLAIPDSSRLGWAAKFLSSDNFFMRIFYFPWFIFPRFITREEYPVTTGVSLTEQLIKLSEEKGYITAYLGGSPEVAKKLSECLRHKHKKLKIGFCTGNIKVNADGQTDFDIRSNKMIQSKDIKMDNRMNPHLISKKIDILFVAFGHKKQEKWIKANIDKLNARVLIGVGGAFDYLSGSVPRAPKIMQDLSLEWLFRVIIQPWRIKRFWKLPVFVYMVVTAKR